MHQTKCFRSIARLVLAVFLVAGLGLSAQAQPAEAQPAERPNIIFIFCDDLGYGDVGVLWQNQRREAGKPAQQTPHIDRLAAEGVTLPHTYCPAPVCAPSRASLMLGVTQGHSNVRNNQFDKALEDNHTLASVLGQAGYATAAFGKWGLQGKQSADEPHGFPAHPMNRGFDYYFGYIRHKDGHMHYPKEDGKELYDADTDVADQLDLCYTTDLFTARAKKWIIDQHAQDADQPFFVYLAYDTPHAILQNPPCPYPQGGGLKGGVQWTGERGRMINTARGTYDGWVHPDYADTGWPDQYIRWANSVRRIDDGVGDLAKLLKDLDIDRDTLIVFTTDNGPTNASYLQGKPFSPEFFEGFGPFDGIKRDLWEGGIRVGSIANWPGIIPAGRESGFAFTLADYLATFADLAGVPAPARADGVSIVPAMTGRGEQQPTNIYIEYQNNGKTPNYDAFEDDHANRKRGEMQAIRLGDYIGVRYDIQGHGDRFEIYNIVQDPKQTTNLADGGNMAELQQQMKDEVLRRRVFNESARRPYDNTPIPPVQVDQTEPGLHVHQYARDVTYVPREPVGLEQNTVSISLDIQDTRTDATTLFVGYLKVPATGPYVFELQTNDRCLLRLHDATLIDNDKPFVPGQPAVSTAVHLEAGLHPIRLYVNNTGGEPGKLKLNWVQGRGEFSPIPAEAFVHQPE